MQAGVESAHSQSRVSDPTALLQAWGRGETAALDRLLPLVHGELRRLARRHAPRACWPHASGIRAGQRGVSPADRSQAGQWRNRAHFFAMASRVMRRILVDAARAGLPGSATPARGRGAARRGGSRGGFTLMDFVALDDALNALEAIDARKCKVVEMRFFGGMSVEETAAALHLSVGTIKGDWRLAKAWLARELESSRRDDT